MGRHARERSYAKVGAGTVVGHCCSPTQDGGYNTGVKTAGDIVATLPLALSKMEVDAVPEKMRTIFKQPSSLLYVEDHRQAKTG